MSHQRKESVSIRGHLCQSPLAPTPWPEDMLLPSSRIWQADYFIYTGDLDAIALPPSQ